MIGNSVCEGRLGGWIFYRFKNNCLLEQYGTSGVIATKLARDL
jgi:hypothetical protein